MEPCGRDLTALKCLAFPPGIIMYITDCSCNVPKCSLCVVPIVMLVDVHVQSNHVHVIIKKDSMSPCTAMHCHGGGENQLRCLASRSSISCDVRDARA